MPDKREGKQVFCVCKDNFLFVFKPDKVCVCVCVTQWRWRDTCGCAEGLSDGDLPH